MGTCHHCGAVVESAVSHLPESVIEDLGIDRGGELYPREWEMHEPQPDPTMVVLCDNLNCHYALDVDMACRYARDVN